MPLMLAYIESFDKMKDKDHSRKLKLLKPENEHLRDKNLYCKFHDDQEYKAKKYYILKNHIEGLVEIGTLIQAAITISL